MIASAPIRLLSPTLVLNALLYGISLALLGVAGPKAAAVALVIYAVTVAGPAPRLLLRTGRLLLLLAALTWAGLLPPPVSWWSPAAPALETAAAPDRNA